MITGFPKPYENELWYSIIARYHKHSGNISTLQTKNDLFGKPIGGATNLLPIKQIGYVLEKLPPEFLKLDDIIDQNTYFNYEKRFVSSKKKKEFIESQLDNKNSQEIKFASKRFKTLKYCPQCAKEEIEKYDEAYWHTDHQIPIMYICHKHRCRLIKYQTDLMIEYNYVCPEDLDSTESYEYTEAEAKLADMAYELWKAPRHISPDIKQTLINASLNAGYRYERNLQMIDSDKLGKDFEIYYGQKIFSEIIYTNTNQGKYGVNRIFKTYFQYMTTSKICLWAAFLNISAKDILEEKTVDDNIYKEFEYFKKNNYKRTDIARALKIQPKTVNHIARAYNIPLYWEPELEETYKYSRIKILDSTWKKLKKIANEQGMTYEKLIVEILEEYIKEKDAE